MLIQEFVSQAYAEARLMQRRAGSVEDSAYLADVALAVARKTGKRIGLDTATRMAMEADFSRSSKPLALEPERAKVDPIDELKRIIGEGRDTEPRTSRRRPRGGR